MFKLLRGAADEEATLRAQTGLKVQAEQRLLLVIKSRWIVLGLLFVYGLITTFSYYKFYSFSAVLKISTMPLLVLLATALCNTAYHLSWHLLPDTWLPRIKYFIRTQLIVDTLVATLLIHFTGGVISWFWTLYVLLIIEYSHLMPNLKDILVNGSIPLFFYTILVTSEYFNLIHSVHMPFTPHSLQTQPTYVLIVWFWVCFLNIAAIFIGALIQIKEKQAIKDGLTGLYSRRFFDYILTSEVERAKRFSRPITLLMIDIDNFKEYNDSFGHLEGDKALKLVGRILSSNIRSRRIHPAYDIDIACRFGGEEFAIILPETQSGNHRKGNKAPASGAVILANKLRKQIKSSTSITVSIGIATFPDHCCDVRSIILAADKALYRAKQIKDCVEISTTSLKKKQSITVVNIKKADSRKKLRSL
ncbi:MAG: diguanylate cyclase [Actinobacteria bacterium]|nr:MAG: diguanylate cyclase [Actinomycetota bacterium]